MLNKDSALYKQDKSGAVLRALRERGRHRIVQLPDNFDVRKDKLHKF